MRYLDVLGTDPEKWARRWGLEPFGAPCDRCGDLLDGALP